MVDKPEQSLVTGFHARKRLTWMALLSTSRLVVPHKHLCNELQHGLIFTVQQEPTFYCDTMFRKAGTDR